MTMFDVVLPTVPRLHLAHSADVLGSLEKFTAVGVPELLQEEADKNARSSTYPTLTK